MYNPDKESLTLRAGQDSSNSGDYKVKTKGGIIANIDADEDVTLKDVVAVAKIEENADDDELEPAELKEVVEVVTTAKLMTEVVTAASATITTADTLITIVALTVAPSAARRRKGVDEVIEQVQRKGKEDNGVMRYQALKRKPQTEAQARKNMMIYLRNMARFKMDYFKGMSYDDIQKAAKKQKLDEEVEELKKHLQIVSNDDEDVYTEATPLARKVLVVDYEIYTENNKPYYKIIRADGSPQLFLSFLSLLRNFDQEDLEMILLVERRYPLIRFTLDQMLNNVRLEVEEERKVSLELLRFMRQQQQEGFKPE
nr:hypothetical protein [Tanacetum cinerariifolium]